MRLDLVSEHANPMSLLGSVDAGGQNVHVADLARALARAGAEVVVHTRRDDPTVPAEVDFAPGVRVHHVDAGPPAPISKDDLFPYMQAFARELGAVWEEDPPLAVLSHFWMSGWAALDAARPLGIPVLHTYHALGAVKRRHQGVADTSPPERLAVETELARQVDRIIATTTDEAFALVAMGACRSRISVIPCGVDLDRFVPDGPSEPRGERPRVVVISRLVERKGIGNVIEAVASLPDVELVVAGGPPAGLLDGDDAARRYLALVERSGAADRIELRGAVERAQVPALIRSADVVACCPWYEPFGLVAVEAMACGVPVVASRVGGLAETVIDGVTGRHVAPRDPAAIASVLDDLLADAPALVTMGAAATQHAQRYGWDRIAGETLGAIGATCVGDVRDRRTA